MSESKAWRLTDEGLEAALEEVYMEEDVARAAAEAQARELVEWLSHSGEWADVPEAGCRRFCIYNLDWEQLRKDVGLE